MIRINVNSEIENINNKNNIFRLNYPENIANLLSTKTNVDKNENFRKFTEKEIESYDNKSLKSSAIQPDMIFGVLRDGVLSIANDILVDYITDIVNSNLNSPELILETIQEKSDVSRGNIRERMIEQNGIDNNEHHQRMDKINSKQTKVV